MKLKGTYLYVVIAMCGLSAATVGLITNLAGLFFTPIAEEFGILQGASSLMLTIANICVALGGLATRRLTKLMPLRVLLVAGTAVLAGSSVLTAFAPSIYVAYVLSALRGLAVVGAGARCGVRARGGRGGPRAARGAGLLGGAGCVCRSGHRHL